MRSAHPARSDPRHGSTLVVVVVLILLCGLGTLMLNRASRQRYLEVHRESRAGVAEYLGEAALNACWEELWQQVREPGAPLYQTLVETPAEDLEGVVEVFSSAPVDELCAVFPAGEAEVEITLSYRDFRPFFEREALLGVARDSREKFGSVELTAAATYRGVTRLVSASRRTKVVSVVAPVLSKFTLAVREQDEVPVNCLVASRVHPHLPFGFEGAAARPLTLFHHPDVVPTVADGAILPLADQVEARAPDSGGLVYLGGDAPWTLNLTHGAGAGPHDELFHLRRVRTMATSARAGVQNEARVYAGLYRGALSELAFRTGWPEEDGRPIPEEVSALHLYGDVGNVSPTPVIGPAFRRFLTATLLDGLWYPHLTDAQFSSLGASFEGGYDAYREVMARAEVQPYNRSYDFIASNHEEVDATGRALPLDEVEHDPEPRLTGPLARVGPASPGDEDFLYPDPRAPSAGALTLRRVLEDGAEEEVFRGVLDDLAPEVLADLLLRKAVRRVPDGVALRREYLKDGVLRPEGIVLVEGPLTLPQMSVGGPGMVVALGDVTLEGPLVKAEEDQPFTLVSLEGDLILRTHDPIQAGLVALAGTARFPGGQVWIRGGLAVGRLDLRSLVTGDGAKILEYDPALDPTVEASYRQTLRVVLDREAAVLVRAAAAS